MQKVRPEGEKNINRTAGIIQGLKENRCPSDDEIRWILQHRETVIGPLLNILEETARWTSLPKERPEERPDAPTHAIFLLAAL